RFSRDWSSDVCSSDLATLMSRPMPLSQLPGRLARDIASAFKDPVAAVCAVLYLAGAAGAVAMFPTEAEAASRQAAAVAAAPAPKIGRAACRERVQVAA